MPGIDRNRLYYCRRSATLPEVYMYKDLPSSYYGPNGLQVSDDVAAKAGFDIESNQRESRKRELKKEALAEIEAKFAEQEVEIDREIDAKLDAENEAAADADETAAADAALQATADAETAATEAAEALYAAEPPGGWPRTSGDKPRETATRLIEYDQVAKSWSGIDKASGEKVRTGIDRQTAENWVMEA